MLESADPFFDLYFDCESRDLPLLITLLGTRNGVAETLRLLSLFDKDYQKLWKPLEVRIFHESVNENEPVSVRGVCKQKYQIKCSLFTTVQE